MQGTSDFYQLEEYVQGRGPSLCLHCPGTAFSREQGVHPRIPKRVSPWILSQLIFIASATQKELKSQKGPPGCRGTDQRPA